VLLRNHAMGGEVGSCVFDDGVAGADWHLKATMGAVTEEQRVLIFASISQDAISRCYFCASVSRRGKRHP
jgi:hypothetical protein